MKTLTDAASPYRPRVWARSRSCAPVPPFSGTASPSSVSYLGCLSPCFNLPALRWPRTAGGQAGVGETPANDNTHALRFYQRRGFALVAVHRNAVDKARRELKPELPLVGIDGIPMRDEIELEMLLGGTDLVGANP